MEAVTSHCEESTPTTLDVDILHGRLEILTATVQFSALMAKANDQICAHIFSRTKLCYLLTIFRRRLRQKVTLDRLIDTVRGKIP
jgi:hypothetical protein